MPDRDAGSRATDGIGAVGAARATVEATADASDGPAGPDRSVGPDLLAGAVVTRRNDLLVVRRRGAATERRWSVPAAAVRRGDTLVETAVRAVAEQAGLVGLSGPFLGWYESIVGGPATIDVHEVVACFGVVVLDDADPVSGADVDEALWMPVWDVSELPLVDGLAELLADHGVIDTLA